MTPRLKAIAELIEVGSRVVDVGTDHCLLPVYLLQNSIASYAAATEIADGPLKRARENIAGLPVKLYNCDGLADVPPESVDTVVIAGMGGESIIGILQAAQWTRNKHLILQPMTKGSVLRRWLENNGYPVTNETTVLDHGRYYYIIETGGKQK
ncbi:MAG: class I SAM-dependent methyltransferase [Oscillospiraceae bacterium]|jgi:tRNA (adenine22-N1)-methyltransferase